MNKCDRCGENISNWEDFCDPCWEALPDADDTEAVIKDCETWFINTKKGQHNDR